MLVLYKSLVRVFTLVAMVGGGILMALMTLSGVPVWDVLLLGLVWLVAWFVIFNNRATKKYNALLSLRDNCQLHRYTVEMEYLLSEVPAKDVTIRPIQILNTVAGYHAMGDMRRAGELILGMQPPPAAKPAQMGTAILYYNNLAAYCLYTEQWDACAAAVDKMQALLQNPVLPTAVLDSCHWRLVFLRMSLRLMRGQTDGIAPYFEELVAAAITPLDKAAARYGLARVYFAQGRPDEATALCRLLAEKGGDTYYATWGREKLQGE